MANTKMQLHEWLDDLCVRFIINLPEEELASVERICFQVEEAQWFYEDFVRPLDASLPHLNLRQFCLLIFQHCPLFAGFSAENHVAAYSEFLAYKTRVPVRGAIMLNDAMDEVVLVKGWKKSANWSFPRGKINKDENDLDCAVREAYEETGYDVAAAGLVSDESHMKSIEITMRDQHMKLYVFRGVPRNTVFQPRTRKEISKIEWYKLSKLPGWHKKRHGSVDAEDTVSANKLYMVAPFLAPLKRWIAHQRRLESRRSYDTHETGPYSEGQFNDEHFQQDENVLPWQNLPVQPTSQLAHVSTDLDISKLPQIGIPPKLETAAQLKQLLSISSPTAEQDPLDQQLDRHSMNLLSMLQQPRGVQGNSSTHLDESTIPHSSSLRQPSQSFSWAQPQRGNTIAKDPPPADPSNLETTQGGSDILIGDAHFADPHPWSTFQSSTIPEASNLPAPKLSTHAQNLLSVLKDGKAVHKAPETGTTAPSSWAVATQASDRQFEARVNHFSYTQPQVYQQTFRHTEGDTPNMRRVINSSKVDYPARPTSGTGEPPNACMGERPPYRRPDHSHSRTRDNLNQNLPATARQSQSPVVSSPPTVTQASNAASPRALSSVGKFSSQQDTLLNLFRTPSVPDAPKWELALSGPSLAPDPVELSAMPSPGLASKSKQTTQHPDAHAISSRILSSSVLPKSQEPGNLSATVSGPQHIPELEKIRRISNTERQSNKTAKLPQQSSHTPVQILKRPSVNNQESTALPMPNANKAQSPSRFTEPRISGSGVFQPRLLRRAPQGQRLPPESPRETDLQLFDNRQSTTNDQKQTLLSLFGKANNQDMAQIYGDSRITSPASALSDRDGEKETGTPVSGFAKSRVGSTGNDGTTSGSEISRSRMESYDTEQKETVQHNDSRKGSMTPISPSDRGFLLSYLEGVVTKGR